MISEFLAPKTQPVWHHFALTQRSGRDRDRHPIAGVAGGGEGGRPQSAGLRHVFPAGLVDPQPGLGARVIGIERTPRRPARPHAALRAVAGAAVAALEGLGRRTQRGGQVQVGPAADGVGDHDLRPLALDQVVDVGQMVDVHRLAELGVLVAAGRAPARRCCADPPPPRRRARRAGTR